MLLRYLSHLLRSRTNRSIHSPFVYGLVTEVIADRSKRESYGAAEAVRRKLLADRTEITIQDFGAGSQTGRRCRVCDIARRSGICPEQGRLLHRLVQRFRPETILELGTSLGIGTAWMATAGNDAQVVSVEGSPETAARARRSLEEAGIGNVSIVTGDFATALPAVLQSLDRIDFAFFDGNHRAEPTLDYFRRCLPLARNDSVFVFHDIHWSADMEKAWQAISRDERVTVTVDLFSMGLVFFRKEQAKEDFVVRW